MSSYEKTKRQYIGGIDQDARNFKAGLNWYMKEKDSIIKGVQPEFEGFGKDHKNMIGYDQYVDEYSRFIKDGNAKSMGQYFTIFEEKYKERVKKNIKK